MDLRSTSANHGAGVAKLPGFGKLLDYLPNKDDTDFVGPLLPSLLNLSDNEWPSAKLPMTTLRELDMLRFMNAITDKPAWYMKINDSELLKNWKDEGILHCSMTQRMVDFCVDELQARAALIHNPANPPPTFVFNGDVYKSDTALSQQLMKALQGAVIRFEGEIPEQHRHWHPHSDQNVCDLVDPSLFPLVYGTTRILPDGRRTTLADCITSCGAGVVIPLPNVRYLVSPDGHEGRRNPYSYKFQWLPCEVDISSTNAKIMSYINNLHPILYKSLYSLIEEVITAAIPLWQLTLAPLSDWFVRPQRIKYLVCEHDPDPANGPLTEGPQQLPGEDSGVYCRRRQEWIEATRRIVLPEPPEFNASLFTQPPAFDLRAKYGSRGLQVIVKLANIQLTPAKPQYDGGTWQIEGQLNEHIVATAHYYYSCENITQSHINFRQQVSEDVEPFYDPGVHDWLPAVFGCQNGGPSFQDVGGVATTQGRLLTFPNILQHQVAPFQLLDPMKPGHRKILVLLLVDPNIKIISTAHVPCQRKDWWWDDVLEKQHTSDNPRRTAAGQVPGLAGLPPEVRDLILGAIDEFPYDMKRAKTIRLELMEERGTFATAYDKGYEEEWTISLCELGQ